MNYDKNSFLAGISVGRTLKGWSGIGKNPQGIQWKKICGGDFSTENINRIFDVGWACGFYYVLQTKPNSCFVSVDGNEWEERTIPAPEGNTLTATYESGNGLFVTETLQGSILVTRDFNEWEIKDSPISGSIRYQSGKFWICEPGYPYSYIYSTKDFSSFESVSINANTNDESATELGFAGRSDRTIGASTSMCFLTSRNGDTLSEFYLNSGYQAKFTFNAFGNCIFICENTNTENLALQYSLDGKVWNTTETNVKAKLSPFAKILEDNSLWITGENETYCVTSDLKTIKSVYVPGMINCFFRGKYFSLDGNIYSPGRVFVSKNLSEWSEFPYLSSVAQILSSNSLVFIVEDEKPGSGVYVSFDGDTWTEEKTIIPRKVFEKDGVILVLEAVEGERSGLLIPKKYSAYVGFIHS